jgi:hypothetical protein
VPLDRFYVSASDVTSTDDDLVCGFLWLLWRPETELHIAFPRTDQLDMALTRLKAKVAGVASLGAIVDQLKRSGVVALENDRRLTAHSLKPRCYARPNGACLLVWGDSKQAAVVEAALGPVGAIAVLPWGAAEADAWIASSGAKQVNCDDPGPSPLTE